MLSIKGKFIWLIILSIAGLVLAVSFSANAFLDIKYTSYIYLILAGLGMYKLAHVVPYSILPRFFILVYFMLYAALIDVLFYGKVNVEYGFFLVRDALKSSFIQSAIANIALIGLIGLLIGIIIATFNYRKPKIVDETVSAYKPRKTLSLPVFVAFGLLLTLVKSATTSSKTIFTQAYATNISDSFSETNVFGSTITYLVIGFLLLLWLDIEFTPKKKTRKIKTRIYLVFLFFHVIWFDILRGDRDTTGLIIAVFVLSILNIKYHNFIEKSQIKFIRKRAIKRLIPFMAVMLIFFVIDAVRNSIAESGYQSSRVGQKFESIYKNGTWFGGFSATVGMMQEYKDYDLEFLNGQTYIDYVLSIPPGPVANFIGYERPINKDNSPSRWYVGYTVGGNSPVVVHFKNFGAFGVLIFMAIFGYIIARAEVFFRSKPSFWSRFIYGSLFVVSLHWFWYGDMYFIRIMMMALIAYPIYNVIVQVRTAKTI